MQGGTVTYLVNYMDVIPCLWEITLKWIHTHFSLLETSLEIAPAGS